MSEVDKRNIAYWDELCGTNLAKAIGVTDNTATSLQRFDDWFFEFYPYLCEHVRLDELSGLDVLEIGLGYGSLSQKIAASGARYTGLDIARGPVEMVRHRLRQAGLSGTAVEGSILAAPFADQSFDRVITIGCLHHTGEMQRAIDECRRLLRGGGSLTAMVYYAYSYRRWAQARMQTLKYLCAELLGYRGAVVPLSESETGVTITIKMARSLLTLISYPLNHCGIFASRLPASNGNYAISPKRAPSKIGPGRALEHAVAGYFRA